METDFTSTIHGGANEMRGENAMNIARPSPNASTTSLSPVMSPQSNRPVHLKKNISQRYEKQRELENFDLPHSNEKYFCLEDSENYKEHAIKAELQSVPKIDIKKESPEDPFPDASLTEADHLFEKSGASVLQSVPFPAKKDGKKKIPAAQKWSGQQLIKEVNSPDSSTDGSRLSKLGDQTKDKDLLLLQGQTDPALSSFQQSPTTTTPTSDTIYCQVCGDLAAGFYCSAYICEACKKFFIRASKLDNPRYVCQRQRNCEITKESRVHCQYCRYQKCLRLNMSYPKHGEKAASKMGVQEIPCRVCSAPSSGFHFGALTCEGCKGFFRRMVKEREAFGYKCSKNSNCEINTVTRNMCKACRYNKCLKYGMSVEGSRIGRQPNAVKHAISIEANKQVALKVETVDETSSPSCFSFDSVELDPCQARDVERDMNATHEDGRDMFSAPQDPRFRHSFHPLKEKGDVCRTEVPVMGLSTVSPTFHAPYSERNTPHMPPLLIDIPQTSVESKEDVHKRSSSNNEYLQRSQRFPPQPSYVFKTEISSSNLSQSCSAKSNSNSYHSRSLGPPSTPDRKVIVPSYSPVEIPFYSPQYQNIGPIPQTTCYQHPLREGEFYKGRQYHLVSERGMVGNREDIHMSYEYRYSSSAHNSPSLPSRDIKPCFCHDPNCQEPCHIDSRAIPIGSSDPRRSPKGEMKSSQQFYKTRQGPIDFAVFKGQEGMARATTYIEHNEGGHFIEEQQSLETVIPPHQHHSPREIKERRASFQGTTPSPSYIPPATTHDAQMYKTKNSQSLHMQETVPPRTLSEQASSLASSGPMSEPRLSSPSPPKDKTLDLSVQKLAHHPRIHCKLTFSKDNVHKMFTLAAKELANISVKDRALSVEIDDNAYSTLEGTWDCMMAHFHFHAQCIVRFAKKIPGFRDLHIDDQVSLLRASTYLIVTLNHARSYEPETEFYTYFNFNEKEKAKIKEFFPELNELPNHFLCTCRLAYKHKFTELEFTYLSCLILLDPESTKMNKMAVNELRCIYMESFHDYEMELHSSPLHFSEMLLCLPRFTKFAIDHNTAVGNIIGKHPQLHVPQLYAEMYS